jgi:hypothetical protein
MTGSGGEGISKPCVLKPCFFHTSYAIDARHGRDGAHPAQRSEQEGGARRVARTSAAMEAAMTRRLDAFATPGAHSIDGADDRITGRGTDAPIRSL